MEGIIAAVETRDKQQETGKEKYNVVIVDSIQTLSSDELDGMAGSVDRYDTPAELLIAAAKSGDP